MHGTDPAASTTARGVRRPWQALVLTRASEFRFLLDEVVCAPGTGRTAEERAAVEVHLRAAEDAAHEARRWWPRRGAPRETAVERSFGELDAAEASLLRLGTDAYFVGQLPSLLAQVRSHLPRGDERLERLVAIEAAHPVPVNGAGAAGPVSVEDRTAAITAFRAAAMEARREIARVHNLSVLLCSLAAALAAGAIALAAVGALWPSAIPLCFTPDDAAVVCPVAADTKPLGPGDAPDGGRDEGIVSRETARVAVPGDIALVELIGLIAAAVAAAASLKRLEGTSAPFNLPLAAAVLKLPTGMLTAVLGLLLMRGDFVPGLSALDNSAQILAWAALFGYAQELFTRFADSRAQDVLGKVGTPGDQKQPDGTTVPSITAN